VARTLREVIGSDGVETAARDRREGVIRAAVELFAERGYKETTATDIAERAGISRRTFFYYFRSKDDILFTVDQQNFDVLTSLVSAQPPGLSDLAAVGAAWTEFGHSGLDTAGRNEARSRVLQLRRAAENSPLLRGKEYELHLAYADAVARGLAQRRGLARPDRRARAAAAMGQSLMHQVVDEWVANPRTDRSKLVAEYFAAAVESTHPNRLDRRRRP
jgi:AcrR family transcriptional regulator